MSLYTIEFTQIAIKTVSKYKKSNPVQYKKLVKLLEELMEHPRTGTGHPEPLKSGKCYNKQSLYPVYQYNNISHILLKEQCRNKINNLSDSALFTFHLVSSFAFVCIKS